jgi:hypothetical protein
MGKLVAAARTNLHTREAACRHLRERDALAQSAKQLRDWESKLCERYPKALLDAFANPEATKKVGMQSMADVAFDELELMDEVQVHQRHAGTHPAGRPAGGRSQLAELNTLICSTLGLGAVNAERNPLRPQIYISALQAVVEQTQLPPATQLEWLGAMSTTLGQELRKCTAVAPLRAQGVCSGLCGAVDPSGRASVAVWLRPVQRSLSGSTQAVAPSPARAGCLSRARVWSWIRATSEWAHGAPADDTLLTLDKLRRLLAGELEEPVALSAKERFAQQFARQFEMGDEPGDAPPTDFDATVPAALEALKE